MRRTLIATAILAALPIATSIAQQLKPGPAMPTTPMAAAPFQVETALAKGIWRVFQDSKGTYWFGSNGNGVYRWHGKGKSFDRFATESGLCSNDIRTIHEDTSGNLYFTSQDGISKFDGQTFTTLKVDPADPSQAEWKLEPDDLWFAGGQDSRAVYRYDGKSLRELRFPATADGNDFEAKWPRSKYPGIRHSPYDTYTIYRDSRGHMWFGTGSLGACRFDGKTFAWISETELEFNEKNNRTFGTRSIIEDKEGKFWITNTRNRFDMNPTAGASTTKGAGGLTYIKSPGLAHPKPGEDEDYTFIMSMTKDKAGDLWMATLRAGIWKYDGNNLTNYPVQVNGTPISVFSIYCDREGGLWLGTHEHGVCKFDGKSFNKAFAR